MRPRSWRVVLLGGLHAESEGSRLHRFSTQKTAALLACLAFYRARRHARETLIEMLWPEADAALGRNSLSVSLSSLRHQLEPPGTPVGTVIRADRLTVGLDPQTVSTDVAEFEAAFARAEEGQSETERTQHLAAALDLYGGPLLPGFYEDWIPAEQERLAQRAFDAGSALLRRHEQAGDVTAAVNLARRIVGWDPLREDAHHHLIRLLALAGQPGTAVRQYRDLERLLDVELGTVPAPSLRALIRRIEDQSGLAPTASLAPRPARAAPAPAGEGPATLTFLLTDVEGSTRLWEQTGSAFQEALALHHAALRDVIAAHGGREIKESGDGFIAAFGSVSQALAAAVAGQQALAATAWPAATGALRVRMALHTGDVEYRDGEYHGLALHRAARMLSAGHGGQVLLSEATAGLVGRHLPPGLSLLDLGVYRLRDVAGPEHLFQMIYPDAPEAFPPLRAEAGQVPHLPLRVTRFFGREQEIETLAASLGEPETRLVTITGPGGTGKTRLALEVSERVAELFQGAVWFVPLMDITDPALCPDAVLDALGAPRSPLRAPLDQVSEFLAWQRSLLVLDNFEQLVEGGADMVRALIARVPALTCLVTSRRSLGLAGEWEFPLAPLPIPNGPDTPERLGLYDSVRLFVDRAQAVRPDFQVTNHNAAAVAALCARLEGIPLAIELAAARAQVLTPTRMLAELGRRFHLLVSRRRDTPDRHRTLRTAIDWSFQLLTSELQQVFSRLSVFRGGWTVEAAEAVCEEATPAGEGLALDCLAQLRECSLILTDDSGPEMRFRMLETLREFGAEEQAEEERAATARRHGEFFLALAEQAGEELRGAGQAEWLARLDAEHDNLRAALAWAAEESDPAPRLRLCGALWYFWSIRGHLSDGRRCLAETLEAVPVTHAEQGRSLLRAHALLGAGALAHDQGDLDAAAGLLEESAGLFRESGDGRGLAAALNLLGSVALDRGETGGAQPLYEEALALFRKLEDPRGVSIALSNLGVLAHEDGDLERAGRLLAESVHLKRRLGNRYGLANSLESLGNLERSRKDPARAVELCREALEIRRELGHRIGIAMSLNNLGHLLLEGTDPESARRHLLESLALFQEMDQARGMLENLAGLAGAASASGGHERAARLLGAAAAGREARGFVTTTCEQRVIRRSRTAAEHSLGEPGFAAAERAGRALSLEEALAEARS